MDAAERQAALERAQQGDSRALGLLLDSFRPYVRVIVHGVRRGRLQARLDDSDLIQDAMLEASKSFASFRGAGVAEIVVWLRRIVIRSTERTVGRYIGAGKRDPAREQSVEELVEHPDNDGSPSGEAIRHEQAARMAEALARLPAEMQEVLLARHLDGLPHATIALRTGRTEGSVRMLYLRALRRLRELYRE
jgi:RNA polymerase sigma-70 factor (ECF subfamily)